MVGMLLGRKLGMTRLFREDGTSVPVSVLELGPCVVTQLRTPERDGYAAVQLGYGPVKPRNSTIPLIGHDARAGSGPLRHHREFRVPPDQLDGFQLGQTLGLEQFDGVRFVDVTATSKGKGFAGTMKRYGFKGQPASHGTERKHRSPGSIAGHATNRGFSGKIKKGKRMAGRLGGERVTVRSLEVVRIEPERRLMVVKGPVPGPANTLVQVRPARRLNSSKARLAAQAAG